MSPNRFLYDRAGGGSAAVEYHYHYQHLQVTTGSHIYISSVLHTLFPGLSPGTVDDCLVREAPPPHATIGVCIPGVVHEVFVPRHLGGGDDRLPVSSGGRVPHFKTVPPPVGTSGPLVRPAVALHSGGFGPVVTPCEERGRPGRLDPN